jgi:uncharacterized protein (DUF1501 family)
VVGAADTAETNTAPADPTAFAGLQVAALHPPSGVDEQQMAARLQMWRQLQDSFLQTHSDSEAPRAHHLTYERTVRLMTQDAGRAFDLSQEDEALRNAYGKGRFGQGCLLARRLIERGVSFVEVSLGASTAGPGWDTHADNFASVRRLSAELDAGWSTLLEDLSSRGLLQETTILWMGEFGRTPKINRNAGRDHFPQAWTCVFAGGGIAGGQGYGRTSPDGTYVTDRQVSVRDVWATLCQALGVSPTHENYTSEGRPIPLVDGGTPITDILIG